jgi:hypothetical protein
VRYFTARGILKPMKAVVNRAHMNNCTGEQMVHSGVIYQLLWKVERHAPRSAASYILRSLFLRREGLCGPGSPADCSIEQYLQLSAVVQPPMAFDSSFLPISSYCCRYTIHIALQGAGLRALSMMLRRP